MDEKEGKFIFISKKERQNIKTITKNHKGNCASYENKEKTWETVEEHVSTINGVEVRKINNTCFQI